MEFDVLPTAEVLVTPDALGKAYDVGRASVVVGQETFENVKISLLVDVLADVTLDFVLPEDMRGLMRGITSSEMKIVGLGKDWEQAVFPIKREASTDTEGIRYLCVPTVQPFVVGFAKDIKNADGVLINFPAKGLFKPTTLQGENYVWTISTTEAVRERPKFNTASRGRSVVSARVRFETTTDQAISRKSYDEAEDLLFWFLTFLSGAHSGLGFFSVLGSESEQVSVGSMRHDPFERSANWSAFHCGHETTEAFKLFLSAWNNTELREALKRALSFYRASTAIREAGSTEMAIVAANTALEYLSSHILLNRAGWSKNLEKNWRVFHDQLRACVKFIGFNEDPFQHRPAILSLFRAQPLDSFEALTIVRNAVAHSGDEKKLSRFRGRDYYEVWQVQMFLVELMLFYLIGYRGSMSDRRRLNGWFGDTIPVPLPPAQ